MIRRAVGLLALALAGCGSEETLEADGAIIGGAADTRAHDSVVVVAAREGNVVRSWCTGTLVAPNLVLTARHCVSATQGGVTFCTADGASRGGASIAGDLSPEGLSIFGGATARPDMTDDERADAHGREVIAAETTTYCDADLAFILLDRPIDLPVAPLRLDAGPRAGEALTAVGWGLTEDGHAASERRRRMVRVDTVGPHAFDETTRNSEGPRPTRVVSSNACGPAFASTGAVVGIASRSGNGTVERDPSQPAASCLGERAHGFYTHLALKQPLVARAFRRAGYTPRDEAAGPGKRTRTRCSAGADCAGGACVEGACALRCADGAGCALGQSCEADVGPGICARAMDTGMPTAEPVPPPPEPAPAEETSSKEWWACTSGGAPARTPGLALAGLALAAALRRRRR